MLYELSPYEGLSVKYQGEGLVKLPYAPAGLVLTVPVLLGDQGNPVLGDLATKNEANVLSAIKQDIVSGLSQFAEWYPDGSVTSEDEFTSDIKYDVIHRNQRTHTIDVQPFCALETDRTNSNIYLSGRVVIPPYVDVEGERYTVTGIISANPHYNGWNENLTELVVPTTVKDIGFNAFYGCTKITSLYLPETSAIDYTAFYMCSSLQSVSLPAVTHLDVAVFADCSALTSIALPAAANIGMASFYDNSSLQQISLPAAISVGEDAFYNCNALELVDFGDKLTSVPTLLSANAFEGVPTTCAICVPDALYDAWTSAPEWNKLYAAGYKFIRKGEKGYVRKHEVVDKTTLTQVLAPFKNLEYDDGYDVDIDTVVSALVQLANLT